VLRALKPQNPGFLTPFKNFLYIGRAFTLSFFSGKEPGFSTLSFGIGAFLTPFFPGVHSGRGFFNLPTPVGGSPYRSFNTRVLTLPRGVRSPLFPGLATLFFGFWGPFRTGCGFPLLCSYTSGAFERAARLKGPSLGGGIIPRGIPRG